MQAVVVVTRVFSLIVSFTITNDWLPWVLNVLALGQ